MIHYTFGNKLTQLRNKRRLSQRQLASQLDISNKKLFNWENGLEIPNYEELKKICNFYKVSKEYFLSDIDESITETDINLIPEAKDIINGNYLCTWWNQSKAAAGLNLIGTGLSEWRAAVSETALFGESNYYHIVPKELRKGLIFLLDDGWDLPIGTPNDDEHRHFYGNVDPDKIKFANFGKSPENRLKGISEKLKDMGYAGLGLWISPQESSLSEPKSSYEYWKERAIWCHNAGVKYWKVDWGNYDYDDEYRKLISDCAHTYAPGLFVEHAVIQKPCTHHNYSDCFLEERANRVKYQMTYSDVYRTYDLLEPFDKVCTLQRAHEALLSASDNASGLALINSENMYTIAAALGFTIGIMNYTHETAPCLKWHRIAPPFGIDEGYYVHSDDYLEDSYYFEEEICSWAPCKNRTVYESAPAVMARNCPLPAVKPCKENAPFVLASKNPKTNAYSVATIRRTVDPNPSVYFPADVEIYDVDNNTPIGVFGVYNRLIINFEKTINKESHVVAQNFKKESAMDITKLVDIESNFIKLDGKLIRMIGENNDPAVIIKVI